MTSTTLIGDLIGSRGSTDRKRLHSRLEAAVRDVNAAFDPPSPLRIQLGDEYQGVFATLGDAIRASLAMRLAMLPQHDVRHGLGRGTVVVLGEEPRVEDGPGWWAARAAIERVEEAQRRPALRSLRTAYVVAPDDPPGAEPDSHETAVNAALVLRDHLVTGLSARSLSVLRGLLAGESQRDLAAALGISPSAVSQRVRADGLAAIVAAHELTGGMS